MASRLVFFLPTGRDGLFYAWTREERAPPGAPSQGVAFAALGVATAAFVLAAVLGAPLRFVGLLSLRSPSSATRRGGGAALAASGFKPTAALLGVVLAAFVLQKIFGDYAPHAR